MEEDGKFCSTFDTLEYDDTLKSNPLSWVTQSSIIDDEKYMIMYVYSMYD